MTDNEREITYVGGPWDGRTRREPKAFWPPQNQQVSPGGEGFTGAWPHMWPADEPRYMPEITSSGQVRMVWAAPTDAHAPRLIEQPESIKDYGDHHDYDD